jgi:hypothetical protein
MFRLIAIKLSGELLFEWTGARNDNTFVKILLYLGRCIDDRYLPYFGFPAARYQCHINPRGVRVWTKLSSRPTWPVELPPSPQGDKDLYFGQPCPYHSTVRTFFEGENCRIYAWPSRGGVIILEEPDAIDFEFLGLNALEPVVNRLEDQVAEDAFCRRLLLTGAKWWDSEERYYKVSCLRSSMGWPTGCVFRPSDTIPIGRERNLIKVGWPSTGGLWVAHFDYMRQGSDQPARYRMARSMDERCTLLRNLFNAVFYEDVKQFNCDCGFLNSWETKETGEAGPLLLPHETEQLWRNELESEFAEDGDTRKSNVRNRHSYRDDDEEEEEEGEEEKPGLQDRHPYI